MDKTVLKFIKEYESILDKSKKEELLAKKQEKEYKALEANLKKLKEKLSSRETKHAHEILKLNGMVAQQLQNVTSSLYVARGPKQTAYLKFYFLGKEYKILECQLKDSVYETVFGQIDKDMGSDGFVFLAYANEIFKMKDYDFGGLDKLSALLRSNPDKTKKQLIEAQIDEEKSKILVKIEDLKKDIDSDKIKLDEINHQYPNGIDIEDNFFNRLFKSKLLKAKKEKHNLEVKIKAMNESILSNEQLLVEEDQIVAMAELSIKKSFEKIKPILDLIASVNNRKNQIATYEERNEEINTKIKAVEDDIKTAKSAKSMHEMQSKFYLKQLRKILASASEDNDFLSKLESVDESKLTSSQMLILTYIRQSLNDGLKV